MRIIAWSPFAMHSESASRKAGDMSTSFCWRTFPISTTVTSGSGADVARFLRVCNLMFPALALRYVSRQGVALPSTTSAPYFCAKWNAKSRVW